jgi:hypothetical protein
MTIQVINPINDLRWDNLIAEHPLSSVYHYSSWKLLIESTFEKLHLYYIVSFDKQGNIKGVLPSFISNKVFSSIHIISLPLATYYDPSNHFILCEAIKLTHQEGYGYFDFGRSSIDSKGLIDFKSRWSIEEKVLHYYFFPYAQSISAESRESLKFRLTKSICKKMPIKLLQTLGDIVYNKYLL